MGKHKKKSKKNKNAKIIAFEKIFEEETPDLSWMEERWKKQDSPDGEVYQGEPLSETEEQIIELREENAGLRYSITNLDKRLHQVELDLSASYDTIGRMQAWLIIIAMVCAAIFIIWLVTVF